MMPDDGAVVAVMVTVICSNESISTTGLIFELSRIGG